MANWRVNAFLLIIASLFLYLQYHLWFEADGIKDLKQLKLTLAKQKMENDKFKKRNDELAFQIERLQHSQDAAEARARNELGMIKKDETFYQIVNK